MYTNAKDELLDLIETSGKQVLALTIYKKGYEDAEHYTQLGVGYRQDQWNKALRRLDFGYDSGYGLQELYGCIWFTDGTHAQRHEYDGSEWWRIIEVPPAPTQTKLSDELTPKEEDLQWG